MDENALLRGILLDQARTRNEEYRLTHTHFFTPAQRAEAEQIAQRDHLYPGCFFYGGYTRAERTIMVLTPDYLAVHTQEELEQFFLSDPQSCPLCVIHAVRDAFSAPSHRDYLGALMGLGIKREMLGDLIVTERGCDIIALRRIARYIVEQFRSAGQATLSCTMGEICTLEQTAAIVQEQMITVRSPRLDAVVSAGFAIPRAQACTAIERGRVLLCSVPVLKPERQVRAGDSITLRGRGKCRIRELGGITKSGRIRLTLEKY